VLLLPRKARQKSESGIYHIIMRGINRQLIFNEDEDYHKFLQTLNHYKEISGYQIYAYCLMSNHIHLLIKIEHEPLAQIMRRICGKFVYWYNRKYDRAGYLFQDRFRSEPVEDDPYLLTVIRYIHQNPLKAKLVDKIEHYPWSSYNVYIDRDSLIDQDFVLKIFGNNREKALKEFIKFNHQITDQKCMDLEEIKPITNQEALNIIKRVCKINRADEIQKLDKKNRDIYLRDLKREGLSLRQLERLTGINRGVIQKA
jgi:putative transposase